MKIIFQTLIYLLFKITMHFHINVIINYDILSTFITLQIKFIGDFTLIIIL